MSSTPNLSLTLLLAETGQLDKKKFVAKYPHPWLLTELVKLPQAVLRGADGRSLATESMAKGSQRMVASRVGTLALRTRPENFVLFAIVKSERNMWTERVYVGRSANNDIVLEDGSVSKAHAYFVAKGSRAELIALPTLNPTKLGGEVIAPQGSGAAVADGAIVEFGLCTLRYFESASLHALLAGKS